MIRVGSGDNTILGGMGGDTITTDMGGSETGTDTILGDNGIVQMDVEGNRFAEVRTKTVASAGGGTVDLGGDDVITGLDGSKIAFGGDGADQISFRNGNHTILGDNGTVNYVAFGQTGAGNVLTLQSSDTLRGTGGNDRISAGNGSNLIIAGMGADQVTTGSGADLILGDNGIVQFDTVGAGLAQVKTLTQASAGGGTVDLGGADSITAADGAKTIIGGDLADTVSMGSGVHTVLGDNGLLTYVAMGRVGAGNLLTLETTDTQPATGGDDIVIAGNGENLIATGMGADRVTTSSGSDVILGDNGIILRDPTGRFLDAITSTVRLEGGDDIIVAGDGSKTVVAGIGSDEVRLGTGTHVVLADNGFLDYSGSGILQFVETTEIGYGGDDRISAAGGDSLVFGGMGDDTVVTGAGRDVIVGDNAFATFNGVSGDPQLVSSSFPRLGGRDVVFAGDGNDILIGGYESDRLWGEGDDDLVIGDSGRVFYFPTGARPSQVESIDMTIGSQDVVSGGGGYNVIIGGPDDDLLYGNLDFDIMAGDYLVVYFKPDSLVEQVIRFHGAGADLPADSNEDEFIERVENIVRETPSVSRPADILIGDAASDARRLYATDGSSTAVIPTILGFQFSDAPRFGADSASPAAPTMGPDQAPTTPPSSPSSPPPGGVPPEGGVQQPAGEAAGSPSPADAAALTESAEIAAVLRSLPESGPAVRVDWSSVGREVAPVRDEQSHELALAGLLGAQVLGAGGKGVWFTADGRVMLERRRQARPGMAAPGLAPGAIESTAGHWMDGTRGLPVTVDTVDIRHALQASPRIDWAKDPRAG